MKSLSTRSVLTILPKAPKAMRVPALDKPPLGHFQALVLALILELQSQQSASAGEIVKLLQERYEVAVDHIQVFGVMRKMRRSYPALIEPQVRNSRGKAVNYQLTRVGHHALKITAEHHVALGRTLSTHL